MQIRTPEYKCVPYDDLKGLKTCGCRRDEAKAAFPKHGPGEHILVFAIALHS